MLQHVRGRHIKFIPHAATPCNILKHAATHSNSLHRTSTHCNTLYHAATHCNTLQHTTIRRNYSVNNCCSAEAAGRCREARRGGRGEKTKKPKKILGSIGRWFSCVCVCACVCVCVCVCVNSIWSVVWFRKKRRPIYGWLSHEPPLCLRLLCNWPLFVQGSFATELCLCRALLSNVTFGRWCVCQLNLVCGFVSVKSPTGVELFRLCMYSSLAYVWCVPQLHLVWSRCGFVFVKSPTGVELFRLRMYSSFAYVWFVPQLHLVWSHCGQSLICVRPL